MVAYTTTYNLKKPTVADDEDVWGGYLNDSMDLIDDVLDGTTPVTGIDINSGTIGGVTVDGTLSFGDSVKANFGASSDMQLFHDGTNSILGITNSHTGKISNVTDNEDFITFTPNNAVTILHNNSEVFTTQTAGVSITGNITVSGTVDGVDIATRDGVLTTTTTTANAALPKAGGTMTGAITFATGQTFDGRDVSADGAKLDGIESGATADQTAAEIRALVESATDSNVFTDADHTKLNGIETGATADQTASEILTAIKTVDGSGSGLDADTLDGVQGSSYLRSDTSDTFTTLSGTQLNIGSQVQLAESSDRADLLQITSSTSSWGGLQIRNSSNEGRWSFMTDGETAGIYNDEDNQWHIYMTEAAGVDLRHAATSRLNTTSSGANVTGTLTTDGLTVDGTTTLNGTLTLGANVINDVEDIYLRDKLYHDGDTDTYLGFGTNQINLVTGNSTSASFNSSGIFVTNGSLAEDYDALSGTSPTCNVDNGGAFSLTMTGNTTFTFSGADSGYSQGFILQLTGNGSTVTWPSSVDWAGGTAPDAPASGETDIYVFWTRDGGTTWYGVQSIDAAA